MERILVGLGVVLATILLAVAGLTPPRAPAAADDPSTATVPAPSAPLGVEATTSY